MNMKKMFVAAFAALAALLFVACDSPERTVKNFHEGAIERDSELLAKSIYIDRSARKKIKEVGEKDYFKSIYEKIHENEDGLAELKSYEIIGSVEDGDDIVYVFVAYKKEGKQDSDVKVRKYTCEKVDGRWKIFL